MKSESVFADDSEKYYGSAIKSFGDYFIKNQMNLKIKHHHIL
jgi:hypothetical protein